jgi:hypothetical protein
MEEKVCGRAKEVLIAMSGALEATVKMMGEFVTPTAGRLRVERR